MTDNFKQTVNLKAQAEAERESLVRKKAEPKPAAKKEPRKEKWKSRAQGIDQVYNDEPVDAKKTTEFQKIDRPTERPSYEGLYKRISVVLVVIIVALAGYWFYNSSRNNDGSVAETEQTARWYAAKLMNGEIYYGEIENTAADPVVIKNVYYNYDQLNPSTGSRQVQEGGEGSGSGGNLRLVKRGKEAHGPEGVMEIVRAQIVYMEPLKQESKVLQAILDYEN